MKIREGIIEVDVDVQKVTYFGMDVAELINDARRLAHHALEDLSIYRQRHDIDVNSIDWNLGVLEGELCEFLDKIGD